MVSIIITKQGLEKIARATVEVPLVLEKFALGDGGGEDISPSEDMQGLVGEKYRGYINDKYSNGNNITCECVLPATAEIEEGFYVREIGIFDKDGVLIAIAKTPLQFRPASEGGNIVTELMFSIVLQVSNSRAITIEIPQTIFATVDALDREVDNREQEDSKLNTLILQKENESIERDMQLQQKINANDLETWDESYIQIATQRGIQEYSANLDEGKINRVRLNFKDSTNTERLFISLKIPSGKAFLLDLWVDHNILTNVKSANEIAPYQFRINCQNENGEIWALNFTNMFKSSNPHEIAAANLFSRVLEYPNAKRLFPKLFTEEGSGSGVMFNLGHRFFVKDNK